MSEIGIVEILTIICSVFLYSLYALFHEFMYKYRDISAFKKPLIERGYDSAYGLASAMEIIPFVLISSLFFTRVLDYSVSFVGLSILTGITYIALAIVLNIWGTNFLIKNGYDPKPKDGYKGIVQNYKERLAIEKEKQRKKKEDSLF